MANNQTTKEPENNETKEVLAIWRNPNLKICNSARIISIKSIPKEYEPMFKKYGWSRNLWKYSEGSIIYLPVYEVSR